MNANNHANNHANGSTPMLYGNLDVRINAVTGLKRKSIGVGTIIPRKAQSHNFGKVLHKFCGSLRGLCNPCVQIYLKTKLNRKILLFCTKTKLNTTRAIFNERFSRFMCSSAQSLVLRVFHRTSKKEVILGEVIIDAEDIINEMSSHTGFSGEFPLSFNNSQKVNLTDITGNWMQEKKKKHKTLGPYGSINFQVRFLPQHIFISDLAKQALMVRRNARNPQLRSLVNYFNFAEDLSEDDCKRVFHNNYFPPRYDENFVIYMSAHQPGTSGVLPGIPIDSSKILYAQSCYRDLSKAIKKAEHFICISTWSLNINLKLIRAGPGAATEPTIGELLKQRASDGVCVLVMLFENSTKTRKLKAESSDGRIPSLIRDTFCKETYSFFKDSKVVCVKSKSKSYLKTLKPHNTQMPKLFDYRDSVIVLDSPETTNVSLRLNKKKSKRMNEVWAFLGGVDITTGRYDDCDKNLFQSLNGVHASDFFNSSNPRASIRQPWQDIYLRVAGAPAIDALQVFFERWALQVKSGNLSITSRLTVRKLKGKLRVNGFGRAINKRTLWKNLFRKNRDNMHEKLIEKNTGFGNNAGDEDDDDILMGDDGGLALDKRKMGYKASFIQILRTGSSNSYKLSKGIEFPRVGRFFEQNVDNSLLKSLEFLILKAADFIYIETERLTGSIGDLEGISSKYGGENMIPAILARKICDKMKAREPFHVYLLLSIYPEGDLNDLEVKTKIRIQYNTLSYIFQLIYKIQTQTGTQDMNISDYISVLSLGNKVNLPSNGEEKIPILIKSNICIVDDKYFLASSTDFSETGLTGRYDSGLGVVVADFRAENNLIKAYRVQLWSQHLGAANSGSSFDYSIYLDPNLSRCINKIRKQAEDNSISYDTGKPGMLGHLMEYPVEFHKVSGTLKPKINETQIFSVEVESYTVSKNYNALVF
eukprot:snap_masked-scaffold_7-processed-gene-4.39-mRNA-1 protein AED:1.00 eAED:1.00 QI:0/-1/0/0/-1/1/1/0/928